VRLWVSRERFVEIKLARGRASSSPLLRGSKQQQRSEQLQRGPGGGMRPRESALRNHQRDWPSLPIMRRLQVMSKQKLGCIGHDDAPVSKLM